MFKELSNSAGMYTFSTVVMIFTIVFFLGILLWALFLKKDFLHKMGNLPLEGEEDVAAMESCDTAQGDIGTQSSQMTLIHTDNLEMKA